MNKVDDPELFLCNICKKYKPMEMLKEVAVKDSWHKKSVCSECMDMIKTNYGKSGFSGFSGNENPNVQSK